MKTPVAQLLAEVPGIAPLVEESRVLAFLEGTTSSSPLDEA
jgi:hypothetical protein